MTTHSGATNPGDGPATRVRHPAGGHDRRVSERIYDYIRSGRPDQRDHHGERPTPPSIRT